MINLLLFEKKIVSELKKLADIQMNSKPKVQIKYGDKALTIFRNKMLLKWFENLAKSRESNTLIADKTRLSLSNINKLQTIRMNRSQLFDLGIADRSDLADYTLISNFELELATFFSRLNDYTSVNTPISFTIQDKD